VTSDRTLYFTVCETLKSEEGTKIQRPSATKHSHKIQNHQSNLKPQPTKAATKKDNMNVYSSTTSTMEETLETIAAMCHQEATGYLAKDWLRLGQSELSSGQHHPLHLGDAVDIECRDKMVAWCVQVVDFCEFSRVTVEITMSYLDRFLATPEGTTARNDRTSYQLACMAALYTAAKIHEPKAIPPELVARFSNGVFTSRDIEAMEVTLLRALKWRVNPPTSWDFMHKLMSIIPSDLLTKDLRQTAVDLALLQTEVAVANYELVTVRASIIAYSTLVDSLESLGLDDISLSEVGYILAQSLCIDCNGDNVSVRSVLFQLGARQRATDLNSECGAPRVANQSLLKATRPRTWWKFLHVWSRYTRLLFRFSINA
jgi:hypothetical protein